MEEGILENGSTAKDTEKAKLSLSTVMSEMEFGKRTRECDGLMMEIHE
jgi:hypothetical protein